MKTKYIIYTMLVTLYPFFTPQYAVTSIEDFSSFNSTIYQNDLIIAHFYFKNKQLEKDSEFMDKYKYNTNEFELAEKAEPFVKFIKINLERAHLKAVGIKYGIQTDLPIFILFKNGNKVDSVSARIKAISANEILGFIQKNFGTEIENKIKILEEINRREQVISTYYYRTSPFYYYPYDYYPYRRGTNFEIYFGSYPYRYHEYRRHRW